MLHEREFERVGESRTIRVDVRVIAATNASLEDLVAAGEFREDLYYRLNVVPIVLPPLRERRDDIPHLAQFFLRRYAEQHKCVVPELSTSGDGGVEGARLAGERPRTGEHAGAADRAVRRRADHAGLAPLHAAALRDPQFAKEHVGAAGIGRAVADPGAGAGRSALRRDRQGLDLHPFLVDGVERELIEEVMRECGGTQVTAADRLGINRNTLHKKWEQYKVDDRAAAAPRADDEAPPNEAAAG